jgi:hypothetical protein
VRTVTSDFSSLVGDRFLAAGDEKPPFNGGFYAAAFLEALLVPFLPPFLLPFFLLDFFPDFFPFWGAA